MHRVLLDPSSTRGEDLAKLRASQGQEPGRVAVHDDANELIALREEERVAGQGAHGVVQNHVEVAIQEDGRQQVIARRLIGALLVCCVVRTFIRKAHVVVRHGRRRQEGRRFGSEKNDGARW
jgi:hypothetical protein